MKLVPGFLAVLALSGAITVSAAAAADQPITVTIDQQKLNLSTSAPVKDHDAILVPMRPIFAKLGLTLVWDAKTSTITASKEGLTIILQLGSKKASVNGTVKQLTTAPKMINNVTYIPLRFVGEATGNSVTWNAKANTVEIKSNQSSAVTKGISELFDKYVSYSNKNDFEGFLSLIDPKSALAAAAPALKEQMIATNTTTAIVSMDIIDVQAKEATVDVVETAVRNSGAFTPDSTSEYIYSLSKNTGSSDWLINNVQIKAIQYSLPDGILEAKTSAPAADEDQIKAVLQANTDYSNKEDLSGLMSTIDESSPAYEESEQTYKQLFAAYDLESAVESSKIIYYNNNEAAIYAVLTSKKLKGPQFTDFRAETVTTLKKSADGKWKLVETYNLKMEPLTK
ncbi:copper amine oxidase N-terminal domain-containing protein [Paenibacillus sp. sgz5001063]|uniref:copper amine oxidase N-terminal domain-containing protein n=1 Tax=Paenibacillus sp. sgz5001063 TaxID=3242474 RepID=UPI0036D3E18E